MRRRRLSGRAAAVLSRHGLSHRYGGEREKPSFHRRGSASGAASCWCGGVGAGEERGAARSCTHRQTDQ